MYERLRQLREERQITQRALSAYLRCTQGCYSKYEKGLLDIPSDILIKLADYYGVSVDYLLGRTNSR